MNDANTDKIRSLPDFEKRIKAAADRAGWELGDRSWAGIILAAFLDPEADAEALRRDMSNEGA